MKQQITILLLFLFGIELHAQITIDSADFGVIGQQVLYASDSTSTLVVDPPTGMQQTFNYTQLVPGFSGYVEFIDPAITPEGALFANATAAISIYGADIFYVDKSDSALNMIGLYSDLLGGGSSVPLIFHPPVNMAKFPMSFGDSFSGSSLVDTTIHDTFTGVFDSIRIKRNVQVSSVVDAYGTLNLQNFSGDVLRQHDTEILVDSAWGYLAVIGTWQPIANVTSENSYYRFIAKNQTYYMLEMQTDLANNVIGVNYQPGNGVIAQITQYNDVFCYGNNDGYAEASAIGGTPPYTYLWSHGTVGNIASSLYAGNYTVTVTDAVGDTNSIQLFIDEPDSIAIQVDSIGADYGNQQGYVHISVSGGTPIFLYNWSNGENNQNISNLAYGDYTVTVTDNNQCAKTATYNVPNITSVDELKDSGFLLYPNPTKGNVQIETVSKWQLQVYSLGGAIVARHSGQGNDQLDLSHLLNGMYVINVQTNGVNAQMQLQVLH